VAGVLGASWLGELPLDGLDQIPSAPVVVASVPDSTGGALPDWFTRRPEEEALLALLGAY
jgi:hypothetical protein